MDKFINFLTSLFVNHPEGMFLYMGGVITITTVNIIYRELWDKGAIGTNGLWDMPEQMFVIYVRWIIPNMMVAAYCLPQVVSVSDALMVFASGFALYALTGRWGLEWLATMKGTTTITKKEITKEHETTKESKVDTIGSSDSDTH